MGYTHLRPDGLLAFSVEAAGGDRYHLQPTRRYAHSRPYLEHLALSGIRPPRHEEARAERLGLIDLRGGPGEA